MGATLKLKFTDKTEVEIKMLMISCVENDTRLGVELSDDEFERCQSIFFAICESPHFDKVRSEKWMLWGTREGFTII